MKLASSAAFLTLALTATLAAQSAPATPPSAPDAGAHFGRHGGPHGPGPFGHGMAPRVQPVANAPLTAQFTQTSNFADRQGAQQQRSTTSVVYRDSQGRVREEVTLPPPPPRAPRQSADGSAPSAPAASSGARTMVTILDPVANTITHLNTDRQTAVVQTLPANFFTRMQQRESRKESGQVPQHGRDNETTTSLGSKTFAGVSATGSQTTVTLPAHDSEAARTITRQKWFSPDLKLEVSSTETGERGTRSDTLTSLSRAEPNPSLFQVPAGYTVINAPEHSFGRDHRGDPGGPDGDGQQPPPPPPAGM